MVKNLINEIEQAMLGSLNNEQLAQLRKVLDYTFRNIVVTEKDSLNTESNNQILVENFISAKKVEGCSPNSILAGYLLSFYCLSHALRTLPIGIAYAIWSALGIVLITLIGVLAFKQVPDVPAYIGLSLIIAGVIVINLFSKIEVH